MKRYDYVVVGAGLFGAVFAREMTDAGKSVLVLEKRDHIGGNIYTEEIEGIQVHKYGAHIFHTNNEAVWTYVNRFAKFNRYTNSPVANYHGELYSLPFNMYTFNKMWGVVTPQEAEEKIKAEREAAGITEPKNLEEQAISLVGTDIYEKLVKGYTEKQWGRPCTELPSFIIRRLPVRYTFDNNYFNARFQGIPIGGYTGLAENLLSGIEVRLNTDYFEEKAVWDTAADCVVYTGPIDRYYGYCYGPLEYRSVRFETVVLDTPNYQGNAVVNYTDRETPWTRIIEHKHFEFGTQEKTVISREYSSEWKLGDEPYYPVNDEKNGALYQKYLSLSEKEEKVIFGGRLAEYKYYDMDAVIASALETVRKCKEKKRPGKLLSVVVPCYNSENYMKKCIDSLLVGGDRVEIIIINDGSKDHTGEIADVYAAKYPDIVRVVHQENGGHGEGINQGLLHATGKYFKSVDSDDWVSDDFPKFLDELELCEQNGGVDMFFTNYHYDHADKKGDRTIRFTNAFPEGCIFTWKETWPFRVDQILMIHTCTFNTEMLRRTGVILPKHTFYEDNYMVYGNLRFAEKLYYMDIDLYHYFIGRADQSVQEDVMKRRYRHQLAATLLCFKSFHLGEIKDVRKRSYLKHEMSIMFGISIVYARLNKTKEAERDLEEMWKECDEYDHKWASHFRYRTPLRFLDIPGRGGDSFIRTMYKLARVIVRFN